MATFTVRANLASALFPFATEMWGRSIIVPGYDMNYDRAQLNLTGQPMDKGIPQVFYMQNVMPSIQGYQSVGYKQLSGIYGGGSKSFGRVYPLNTADGGRYLFSPAEGKNFLYDAAVGDWQQVSPIPAGTLQDNALFTTATINGKTYICYEAYDVFEYDNIGNTFTAVTLTGLIMANIRGITASSGYMIGWTASNIVWSSLTDELDFTPSLATGAGTGAVQEAKGDIQLVLPVSGGIMVYCKSNVVYGKYTGNEQFPFSFHEIPGSGFITDPNQVVWHSTLPYHVAKTSNGMQQFDAMAASNVYNDVTDFLAAKIYEVYTHTTKTLSTEYLTEPLSTAVAIVQARYVVFSYGKEANKYTHALVYDLNLKRYGKLCFDHVSCFEWNFPTILAAASYDQLMGTSYTDLMGTTYDDLTAAVTPNVNMKGGITFLTEAGAMYVVDFSAEMDEALDEAEHPPVLFVGKFQFERSGGIEVHSCEVEAVDINHSFDCFFVPSYDGKTLLEPRATYEQLYTKSRKYLRHLTGESVTLLFQGYFMLSSLLISYARRDA